jgi:hypothetical protein
VPRRACLLPRRNDAPCGYLGFDREIYTRNSNVSSARLTGLYEALDMWSRRNINALKLYYGDHHRALKLQWHCSLRRNGLGQVIRNGDQ